MWLVFPAFWQSESKKNKITRTSATERSETLYTSSCKAGYNAFFPFKITQSHNVWHCMGDKKTIFFLYMGGGVKKLGAPKEYLLKPTPRLPHRTSARQLDAPLCGTHRGTLLRLGIRITAVGEERRAFEAHKR